MLCLLCVSVVLLIVGSLALAVALSLCVALLALFLCVPMRARSVAHLVKFTRLPSDSREDHYDNLDDFSAQTTIAL